MERLSKKSRSVMSDQAKHTHKYLSHELDVQSMGMVILLCFFTSGLIDSVAFNSWNCFVGMQTGKSRLIQDDPPIS
jgi:hypothetical protein